MMYRRGRRRSTRRFRRKPRGGGYMGGAAKAIAMAGSALAIARGVKSLLNVEYKNYTNETTFNNRFITNLGTDIFYMLPIPEGTGENERNGNSVKVTQFYLEGRMKFIEDGEDVQTARFILVQDKAMNGTNIITWNGDANSLMTSGDVIALKDLGNTDRFKVLMDKKVSVWANKPIASIKCFKKLNDRTEFNTDGGDTASAGFNSLWWLMISDQPTEFYPRLDASWRVRYIDN